MTRTTEPDGPVNTKQIDRLPGTNYLEIKACKTVLYLTEAELLTGLTREALEKGLQRGKGVKRRRQMADRNPRHAQQKQGY